MSRSLTRPGVLALVVATFVVAPAARAEDWPLVPLEKLTKSKSKGELRSLSEDLADLSAKAAKLGTLYGGIGTVVGGSNTNGTKVGVKLHDESARIDLQNPPAQKMYNLQYQVGKASYACALYTAADTNPAEILHNLERSLANPGMAAMSPRYKVLWDTLKPSGKKSELLAPKIPGSLAAPNDNVLILYQDQPARDSHEARAKALAKAMGGAHCLPLSGKPARIDGLTTLTVWGHGTFVSLCDLKADEFVKLVNSWKQLNPKLNTVEILTCNARHAPEGYDPYANQVVKLLGRSFTVKALPSGLEKDRTSHSILLATDVSSTYCYITAADDDRLQKGANAVRAMSQKVTPKYDLSQAANNVSKDTALRSQFTLLYGPLRNLRNLLVVVK